MSTYDEILNEIMKEYASLDKVKEGIADIKNACNLQSTSTTTANQNSPSRVNPASSSRVISLNEEIQVSPNNENRPCSPPLSNHTSTSVATASGSPGCPNIDYDQLKEEERPSPVVVTSSDIPGCSNQDYDPMKEEEEEHRFPVVVTSSGIPGCSNQDYDPLKEEDEDRLSPMSNDDQSRRSPSTPSQPSTSASSITYKYVTQEELDAYYMKEYGCIVRKPTVNTIPWEEAIKLVSDPESIGRIGNRKRFISPPPVVQAKRNSGKPSGAHAKRSKRSSTRSNDDDDDGSTSSRSRTSKSRTPSNVSGYERPLRSTRSSVEVTTPVSRFIGQSWCDACGRAMSADYTEVDEFALFLCSTHKTEVDSCRVLPMDGCICANKGRKCNRCRKWEKYEKWIAYAKEVGRTPQK